MLPKLTLALSLNCHVLVTLGSGEGGDISSPLIGTHDPGLCDMGIHTHPLRFALPAPSVVGLQKGMPPLHSDALSSHWQVLGTVPGARGGLQAAIHPHFNLMSSP